MQVLRAQKLNCSYVAAAYVASLHTAGTSCEQLCPTSLESHTHARARTVAALQLCTRVSPLLDYLPTLLISRENHGAAATLP